MSERLSDGDAELLYKQKVIRWANVKKMKKADTNYDICVLCSSMFSVEMFSIQLYQRWLTALANLLLYIVGWDVNDKTLTAWTL